LTRSVAAIVVAVLLVPTSAVASSHLDAQVAAHEARILALEDGVFGTTDANDSHPADPDDPTDEPTVPDDPDPTDPDEPSDSEVTGDISGLTIDAGETVEIVGDATSTTNVVVNGTLKMRGGSTLTFVDVDETAFVGGDTHHPVETDVGLWVMGKGVLDLQGTPRQGWNRTGTHDTWQPSDEYVRAPHGGEKGPQPWTLGDPVPCTDYNGEEVCAEIVNLTRDVIIQGTESGRTHLFIHSSQPHTIRHVAIRHVGIDDGGPSSRYGLHFHHGGDGSRGTVVEGVVVAHSGSHAFVPHASHGITFTDVVAYDTRNSAFWWDPDDLATYPTNATHDVTYDRALALQVHDGGYQTDYRLTGFYLGQGEGNRCTDCAAVDVAAKSSRNREMSGFYSPRSASGVPNVWTLENLVSHHNNTGFFNRRRASTDPAVRLPGGRVDGLLAYRNWYEGIHMPTYRDNWAFYDVHIVDNRSYPSVLHRTQVGGNVELPANNKVTGLLDGSGRANHVISLWNGPSLAPNVTVVWTDLTLRGWKTAPVLVRLDRTRFHDFVGVDVDGRDMEPADFDVSRFVGDGLIRVQRRDGTAFAIDSAGVRDIDPFAEVN
jgi:hypothetical protein